MTYTPAKSWHGRVDSGPKSTRLHQVIQPHSVMDALPSSGFALIGFASDAGVHRNHGRVGAKDGPEALRKSLASLPCQEQLSICDLGTIHCEGDDLENAQDALAQAVSKARTAGLTCIVLGGGHETAWGHYCGMRDVKNLGIINFDAHYDLRPLGPEGQGSSGTPFLQIAQDRLEQNKPFHYCCVGVQELGNTEQLFAKADELSVHSLSAQTVATKPIAESAVLIENFLSKVDALYISFCLDVFVAEVAPGVSAPQAFGLHPWQLLPLLDLCLASGKAIALDVVELNPRYDIDSRTARLGASLIAHALKIWRPA